MKPIRNQKSQGAVEFALVLPVLLIIIFGLIEVGHLFFVYASVLNATREAARYGAVTGLVGVIPQYQDCTGIENSALNVRFLASFTSKDIIIKYDQGPGTAFVGTPPGGPPPEGVPCSSMSTSQWSSIGTGSRIVVSINSPFSVLVPLIPIQPFTIHAVSSRTILGSIGILPPPLP